MRAPTVEYSTQKGISHLSQGAELYLRLFNSLISQLCHYYAIASEKFICFLWSAVDGRMMKHKPCFWRNMLQSGPRTLLPALNYTRLRLGQREAPLWTVCWVLSSWLQRVGEGIFLITSQQYRHPSSDDIKYKVPEGKLDTLEGEHVVMTAESSKRNDVVATELIRWNRCNTSEI